MLCLLKINQSNLYQYQLHQVIVHINIRDLCVVKIRHAVTIRLKSSASLSDSCKLLYIDSCKLSFSPWNVRFVYLAITMEFALSFSLYHICIFIGVMPLNWGW